MAPFCRYRLLIISKPEKETKGSFCFLGGRRDNVVSDGDQQRKVQITHSDPEA